VRSLSSKTKAKQYTTRLLLFSLASKMSNYLESMGDVRMPRLLDHYLLLTTGTSRE
jgi:hypothetical protein